MSVLPDSYLFKFIFQLTRAYVLNKSKNKNVIYTSHFTYYSSMHYLFVFFKFRKLKYVNRLHSSWHLLLD